MRGKRWLCLVLLAVLLAVWTGPAGAASAQKYQKLKFGCNGPQVALLQQTGPIREMTIQPQNIDVLIATMYREMDL